MANEFKAKLNPFTGQLQLIPTNIVLAFKAGVATQANLPLISNAKGDARIANDSGHLYVWSIEAATGLLTDWVDAGDIVDLEWSAISGKPSSTPADIDDAVSKRHTQNTDQKIDDGGANETTAAEIRDSADKKHTQNTDTKLDDGGVNEITAANAKAAYTHSGVVTGNPHAVSKSDVGLGNVDNVSEATIISDVKADSDVADAISKKHTQGTDQALDTGGANEITAANAKAAYTHSGVVTGNPHAVSKSDVGLGNVTNDVQLKSSQLVKGTFVDGDLVAGVLTITHNLGLVTNFSVLITIIDDNDKVIIPDEIACLTNTTTVDLTSYGTLTGTWKYILLG
jgi:hypothetical protein